MMQLPANISASGAKLPRTYEAAKNALANCVSIDECQEWANKAEALASYAKQADDDSLRKYADRIQARAVRRCGELLKTFNNERARTDLGKGDRTQTTAARDAGMSRHQQITAVRVANVPRETFEREVESPKPPTVTKLADMGKTYRGPKPENFAKVSKVVGALKRFLEYADEYDAKEIAESVSEREARELRQIIHRADKWLDRCIVNLPGA
jgi:hypothetical protein